MVSVVPFRSESSSSIWYSLPVRCTRDAVDLDGLLVEVDDEVAGGDDRLGVALRAAHDGVDAGDELVLVERLGQVVVGAEAEALHLVLDAGHAGEDQDRRLDLGDAQRAQHLVAGHVGQVQVEQDDVVIVELAEIDALLAEVGGVDVEVLGLEHQLDALRRRAVVLDQQNPHVLDPRHGSPLRDCGACSPAHVVTASANAGANRPSESTQRLRHNG